MSGIAIPIRRGPVALMSDAQLRAMPERIDMMDERGRPYKKDIPSGYVMYAGAGFGVPYEAYRRDLWEADRLSVIRKHPGSNTGSFWECALFPDGEEVVAERDLPPLPTAAEASAAWANEEQARIVGELIGGGEE